MTVSYTASRSVLPYKSVAVALLFSVILGPVGLLYSSFRGGIFLILIGMVVVSSRLPFPILLLWIVCAIWAVGAAESYNRKLLQRLSSL
jgi:hypothetical protein